MWNLGRKKITTSIVAVAAIFLCQCSKDGPEKDFEVSVTPTTPLVKDFDRTLGNTTIRANWFTMSAIVTNKTGRNVRIEDVSFFMTSDVGEGSAKNFDLGLLQAEDADGNQYDYINYCIYPKEASTPQNLSACRGFSTPVTTVGDGNDGSGIRAVIPVAFIIDGIEAFSNPRIKNYRVRMELIGAFIDDNGVEVDRFNKRVNFTTR
jgi:hypothetical protein